MTQISEVEASGIELDRARLRDKRENVATETRYWCIIRCEKHRAYHDEFVHSARVARVRQYKSKNAI